MANKYYYLTASLPYLQFDKAPLLTKEAFFAECEKWLSENELNLLKSIELNTLEFKTGEPVVILEWKIFNLAFHEEIASIRKARKVSLDEKTFHPQEALFGETNPLLIEKKFEKKRWDYLDEKETDYHFDTNFLIVYLLKLEILERLSKFDKEKGKKVFEETSEVIYG